PVQCLHYCLTRPAVASVMVGFSNIDHVREACSYETATDEEKDYASVLASAPKHAFGGECTYCGHCQPCPMGIHIAMVNKFYDLAAMQSEVPASIREHYFAMEKNASDCIGCKSCETRCPFGVKIAERMLKTKAFFE
ncbi:MAG: 4Fe-4S dicluster domain-containing protein, partial [Christensenellaceae bacterium]|nr:4Fe-4S dicluster domain-containing protein [Christensenellaceae bacterium]